MIVIDPDHRFGLNRAGTTSTACTPRVSFFFKLSHVPHPGGLSTISNYETTNSNFGVACNHEAHRPRLWSYSLSLCVLFLFMYVVFFFLLAFITFASALSLQPLLLLILF